MTEHPNIFEVTLRHYPPRQEPAREPSLMRKIFDPSKMPGWWYVASVPVTVFGAIALGSMLAALAARVLS